MFVFLLCFQLEHNILFIPFAAVYVSFCARQRGNVVYSGLPLLASGLIKSESWNNREKVLMQVKTVFH